MIDIPDAPWIGKCAEEYYGYGEIEYRCCAYCGEEYEEDELKSLDGDMVCRDCYNTYNGEEEDDEELYG